jgi:hypothetical protein
MTTAEPVPEPPRCTTCNDTGLSGTEAQIGVPLSEADRVCPDCPVTAEPREDDDVIVKYGDLLLRRHGDRWYHSVGPGKRWSDMSSQFRSVYVPAARLAAAQQEIGRLTVRGRQEAAIGDTMRDRALTAERRVACVQALCDDPGALYYGEDGELSVLLANDVRAALDGTQ